MLRILIVEDDESMKAVITRLLQKEKYEVITASSGLEAEKLISRMVPHLILLDFYLPDTDGLALLNKIKSQCPEIIVIIMTARGNISNAVESMKQGAYDFVEKSADLDRLVLLVKRALYTLKLKEEVRDLRNRLEVSQQRERWIGESSASRKILSQIDLVARTGLSVLVVGETGTGKELVARMIHERSLSSDHVFVPVDCGAIPDTLFESEMFGHEKGSFTGAVSQKVGKFEQASGGTLFMDEISNLPLPLQAKLLRSIQEKKIFRVGGRKAIDTNARIISASNRDIQKLVHSGEFKDDLYFRINEFTIHIPPLRERTEDIVPLAWKYLNDAQAEFSKRIDGFTPHALQVIMDYHWPGNVRELRNTIRKAVLISESGMVDVSQLMVQSQGETIPVGHERNVAGRNLTQITEDVRIQAIERALQRSDGNKTEAARQLGISRRQLYREMERYKLPL